MLRYDPFEMPEEVMVEGESGGDRAEEGAEEVSGGGLQGRGVNYFRSPLSVRVESKKNKTYLKFLVKEK